MDSIFCFGWRLQRFPRTILYTAEHESAFLFVDLFAAVLYVFYYGSVAFFAIFIAYYYWKLESTKKESQSSQDQQEEQPYDPSFKVFLVAWSYGWLGIFALCTQTFWPTAPPWYNDMYGTQAASYTLLGNPGDLARLDSFFNMQFFKKLYENNPVVFGAFPSLHVAHPALCAFFMPGAVRFKYFVWLYPALVAWAALYLNHHFFTDVLGGVVYAYIATFIMSKPAEMLIIRLSKLRSANDQAQLRYKEV